MELSSIENILIGIDEEDECTYYTPTVWLGAPDPRVLELDRCKSEDDARKVIQEFLDMYKAIIDSKD